jgi:hypothetical protein
MDEREWRRLGVLGADMTAVLCGGGCGCGCGCEEDKRPEEEEFQMGDDVVEGPACIQCGLTLEARNRGQ